MKKRRFLKVKPSDILVDPEYQRILKERRAKSFSEKFDEQMLGVPVLSKRADGRYYVIDGQHRVTALQLGKQRNKAILCEIYEGMTVPEEALLFDKLNFGSEKPSAYDKFRARVVGKDQEAVEIKSIVESAGLTITRGKGVDSICAIGALQHVYKQRKNLADVVRVLVGWSEGDPRVFEGRLIRDIAAFLAHYPDADLDFFIEKLASMDPGRVLASIKRLHGFEDQVPRPVIVSTIFRDIYNKKTPRSKKLRRTAEWSTVRV